MKVIDLLNKIANGEELPNEIKYGEVIYKRYEYNNKYYKNDDRNREKDILSEHLANESFYNSRIEVIEEDKKIEIPKHIPNEVIQDLDRAICPANVKCIAHKVNELINYLQHTNKGDSNK